MEVSYFENIAKYSGDIHIDTVLQQIKSGEKNLKEKIEQIRACKDKKERNKIKRTLPAITVSGKFKGKHSKNALLEYSGLLQIDIDNIDNPQELKEKLIKEPFIYAVFISPSGNGLKALVRIEPDPQKHLQYFEAISIHFQHRYSVEIDKQTKDVSRLMYLSYDPELYINPQAQKFILPEERLQAPQQTISQDSKTFNDREKNELVLDVEKVIEQIEHTATDIAPTYNEWLACGFALADGLGEQGRQYFIRMSSVYTGEQKIEPNRQYDYCLKYSRNNGIAPFFAMAKKYGLDIKPTKKNRKSVKLAFDINTPLPETDNSTLDRYNFFIHNGCYYVKHTKDEVRVSNFRMQSLLNIDDGTDNSIKLMKFQIYNQKKPFIKQIRSNKTQWKDFRTFMRSNGLSFTGTMKDFELIWEYLVENEKTAMLVNYIGWNSEYEFFAFADGLVDTNGEFHKANNLGLVEFKNNYFYFPAASQTNKNNDTYTNWLKFQFRPGKFSFNEFSKYFYGAYGFEGAVGIMYLILTIFRDIVYHKLNFFPFLFLYGEAQAGKTSYIRLLTNIFGADKGISLQSTATAMFRETDSRINTLLYIKEFERNLKSEVINFFLTSYDGGGRSIGAKTTDNRTIRHIIKGGIIIDGNEPPYQTNALLTRMIMLTFQKRKTELQTENFSILDKASNTDGFAQVLIDIIKYRKLFEQKFLQTYSELMQKLLLNEAEKDFKLDSRLKNHFILTITPYFILRNDLEFPFSEDELKRGLYKVFKEQQETVNENNDVVLLLRAIEWYIKNRANADEFFMIDEAKGYIYFNFNQVYEQAYLKYMAELKKTPKSSAELRKILQLACEKYNIQIRFSSGKNKRAYALPVKILYYEGDRYIRYQNFEFDF